MIQTEPLFPDNFDGDDYLYLVHDKLRMVLAEDYTVGDTSITVKGESNIMSLFPPTGIITLTEQCSEIDQRAISLHYDTVNSDPSQPFTFEGLEIMPGFEHITFLKPKDLTNVTLNVYKDHHNNLKDTLITIQKIVGVKGTTDIEPFGETMEGRTNFLRKIALSPKAWFSVDRTIDIVPFEVEFTDLSFRLATDDGTLGPLTLTWDFKVDSVIPDTLVQEEPGQTFTHIYTEPGIYTVRLTVENDFGVDVVEFPDLINARIEAPDKATINFIEQSNIQDVTPGTPSTIPSEPFAVPPVIRSPINALIEIEIPNGINPNNPGHTFAGEPVDGFNNPIDPILAYTWNLGDDLTHGNNQTTKASYSVGGFYDLKVRVDTTFGAYRITTYENSMDIIEKKNLWLWIFTDSINVRAYEFGLISETFKLATVPTLDVVSFRDDSFLDGVNNEEQQKREFNRNVGFAPRSTVDSGSQGTGLLYWATGKASGAPVSDEEIAVRDFNGFANVYLDPGITITRPWNWVDINSNSSLFFLFGTTGVDPLPFQSPTNDTKTGLVKSSLTLNSTTFAAGDFLSGAEELLSNVVDEFDISGEAPYGNFSITRSVFKDNTGYIARNDGIGPTFRIKSFYRTEGSIGAPVNKIRKLQDIQGSTKLEGDMTNLTNGIYFFDNSGSVSVYQTSSGVWATGGPGLNSITFRSLQDPSVSGFDSTSNTLLLTSDGDRRAYIVFDYSPDVFLKFNEADLTFSALTSRPVGTLWNIGTF